MPSRRELTIGLVLALGILAVALALSVTPPPWRAGTSVSVKSNINARVQAVLDRHERRTMTPDQVEAMRAEARTEFAAALVERGDDPAVFDLVVHVDELVGPMAMVTEVGGEKRHWPLAAFEGALHRK